jgi:polyhydroxybutyrate depolymerase
MARIKISAWRSAFIAISTVLLLSAPTIASTRNSIRENNSSTDLKREQRSFNTAQLRAPFGPILGNTLDHQGITRTYDLYIPSSYQTDRPIPLVLAFHGGGGSGRKLAGTTRLNNVAEREGFIVVYPDGINNHWNDGRGVPGVNPELDDVSFVKALIRELQKSLNIDRRRIYATGISNGGMFTQRLACELSGRIAGFASVVGSLPAPLQPTCKPKAPVSMLMLNSPRDQFIPWQGGMLLVGEGGKIISIPQTIEFWKQHNACSSAGQVQLLPDNAPNDGTRVRKVSYTNCRRGSEVVLYTIFGGGHTWPGAVGQPPQFGVTSRDINGSEVIWDFFKSKALR